MKALWICCNARTGSNFLCELLNNTELFPVYKEGKAFGEWIKLIDKKEFYRLPLETVKMIHEHFVKKLGNVNAKLMREILPGIKFILLKRRNVLEHAASLYFARFTNAYYLSHENQKDWYYKQKVSFYPTLCKSMIDEVIEYQNNWDNFFIGDEKLTVYYEDLIENPAEILSKVLSYYGIDPKKEIIEKSLKNRNLVKMTRPEVQDFINYSKSILL